MIRGTIPPLGLVARALMTLLVLTAADVPARGAESGPSLRPLPPPVKRYTQEQIALGKLLFFEGRISGDGSTPCASCHSPEHHWSDGQPLSKGYPGSLYFRNTPTVLNAAYRQRFFWDGRLAGSDLATLIRDHIAEAHFMNADGRLIIERLRQIPGYEKRFQVAFGREPGYGSILNALAAFVSSLRSKNAPVDRFLAGDRSSLSSAAGAGYRLFTGKAGCVQCHNGSMLSDGRLHRLGIPDNDDIYATPERHITFRRFLRTMGVPEFQHMRGDPGLYAVTKETADRGKFLTPSLREVSTTAPYMHNGMFETLDQVVDFYDRGGGEDAGSELAALGLTDAEKKSLVAFLEALSGDRVYIDGDSLDLPAYAPRQLGEN